MKPYSYTISKPSEIHGVISAFHSLGVKGSSLLISIFTSYTKAEGLQYMVEALSSAFPKAEISGMTSSVCINQGVNHRGKIVLLFEVFEKTYVHTICFDHEPGKEEAVGCAVMSEIAKISEPLCGIEILASQSDDRFSDFTPFLNVLTRDLPTTLPVWGALADSQTWPDHTYVFSKNYISSAGLILRVYTGEISIMLNHVLGFRPLSRPLTVTAMDGPMIIKELDHKPAVYYYDKYIHTPDFQEQSLPFPLIQQYDGYDHAHLPQGRTLDGGIIFNIRCAVGTELRLSYGDPELMLAETKKIWEHMHAFGGESAHILSCAARYQFLNKNLGDVLANYNNVTPSFGIYAHGEIYRAGQRLVAAHLTGNVVVFREAAEAQQKDVSYNPVHLTQHMTHLLQMATFVSTAMKELEETKDALQFAATHDSLSGLFNRGAMEKYLAQCIKNNAEIGMPLSAIMIDLDHFKTINDTYGHSIGDAVIRTLADLMRKHTAGRGYAGRWGGDEFLIILPGSTLETAEALSIHMKDALLHAHVLPDDSPVSASFGVTIARPGELEQSFYKRVDNALYTSKENGKNRITIFDANGTTKALTMQETGDW